MKTFLKAVLLLLAGSVAYAGVQIQQGDAVTFSSVTVTGAGIKLPDGTVLITTSTSGGGAIINLGTQVTGTLAVTNGGTGATSATLAGGQNIAITGSFPNQTIALSDLIPIAFGGTGTATPGLIQGTNITISGSWPNQTINSTAGGTTVYPASSTANFPFGYSASTATFTGIIAIGDVQTAGQQLRVVNGGTSGAQYAITGTANGVGTGQRYGVYGWGSGGDVGSNFAFYAASGSLHLADVASSILAVNPGGVVISTSVNVATEVIGILPIANGGTGTASPGLVQGTNVTITGSWPNQTINATGGGSSGGASTAAQILDCQVTRVSNTVLAIASTNTLTNPCVVHFNNVPYLITSSATVTLVGVTGMARIYVSGGSDAGIGTIQVRNSGSSGMTCSSGCGMQNSLSVVPGDAFQLATWSASSAGVWDSTGSYVAGVYSAVLPISTGAGLTCSGNAPQTCSVDGTIVPIFPAVHVSTGNTVGFDEYQNGTYVAISTITWTNGNEQAVTLTANTTFNFVAPTYASHLQLRIKTGAGSFTASWPGSVHWGTAGVPTITATGSKKDIINCWYSVIDAEYDCQAGPQAL